MADIFISYAKEDQSRAEPLAKALEDKGWSVWWDPQIPPGKTFFAVIKDALEAAKCVVVLWSKQSINSEWVLEEANIGKRRGILVPAKIDFVDPPLGFGLIQAADLTDWETETSHAGLSGLLSAISEIVGPPPKQEKGDQVAEIPESSLKQQLEVQPEAGEIPQPTTRQPESGKIKPSEPKPGIKAPTEPKFSELRKPSKILKYSLLAGVIMLLMTGGWFYNKYQQQQQRKIMPAFKFGGITLSKEFNKAGDLGIPIEPDSEFDTGDDKIIALVRFENLAGRHNLRWEWYDPSGNLYYSTDNSPLKTSSNTYRLATAWHELAIKGESAANYPGQWEVKVFLDDELMDTKPFLVKEYKDLVLLPTGFAQRPYPKDWGLIIGIEDYAHLPTADYARKDALLIKEYFIKVLGVPENNIISLIDSNATKAQLEAHLKVLIPSNVSKDSILYVYFAGHGAPGMKNGDPYLIPYDCDMQFLDQTGYKLVNFYKDLSNLKIPKAYVFLDSCFSGVAARAAEMIKGARPALIHVKDVSPPSPPSDWIIDLNAISTSIISLISASPGQISMAYPEKEHGLFTYFLLRALNGGADSNDDGWTSLKEMYWYVKDHVARVARKMGTEQTPVLVPSPKKLKDVAISKVPR